MRTLPLTPWSALLLMLAGSVDAAPSPPPRAPAPTPPPLRPPPPVQAPGSCVGRWLGSGRGQTGSAWTIDMTVTSQEATACGVIEYPSLGCGGFLRNCRVEDGVVVFRELYTHNPGTCAPAGTIRARCVGDTMQWRWDGWETVRTILVRAPR